LNKPINYLDNLATQGKHCFTTYELMEALGLSKQAAWSALSRLLKKGLIATPGRRFHILVPPEYQHLGCLPPEQFVPNLMGYMQMPYYVGLLSAAQYYGASTQQAHNFQLVVPKSRGKIRCGQVQIEFISKESFAAMATRYFNTPKKPINVASPEVTALDVVNYPSHCEGLSTMATVLKKLAEQIQPDALMTLAKQVQAPAKLQRLGFWLEAVQSEALAQIIEKILQKRPTRLVALIIPKTAIQLLGKPINKRWKIIQNEPGFVDN
jgi:predicted transcriptional regulator of viral defense system